MKLLLAGAAVLCPSAGLFLALVQRDGMFSLPGGHIESHETPEDAARRELYEEAGMQARQLFYVMDFTISFGAITRYFVARDLVGTLKASREGRPIWLTRDDLCGPRARFRSAYSTLFELLRDSPLIR